MDEKNKPCSGTKSFTGNNERQRDQYSRTTYSASTCNELGNPSYHSIRALNASTTDKSDQYSGKSHIERIDTKRSQPTELEKYRLEGQPYKNRGESHPTQDEPTDTVQHQMGCRGSYGDMNE